MSIGKLAVLAVALVFASAGVGAGLAGWSGSEPGPAIDLGGTDGRKDDAVEAALVDDDDDDGTGPGPGPRGSDATDDRDAPALRAAEQDSATNGPDSTRAPRAGGAQSVSADSRPAPRPAPAPAPAQNDDSVSAAASVSAASASGASVSGATT